MTVHYTGGGGGFLGSLGKIASLGAMFVPGMQPWAAAIGAAGALANGDPVGAAMNAGLGFMGNKLMGTTGTQSAQGITATGNPPGGVSAVSNAGVNMDPPIPPTATGNPTGGVSAVSNMGVDMELLKPTGSFADTLANLMGGNPSSEMARMFEDPWERSYYMNPARRRF